MARRNPIPIAQTIPQHVRPYNMRLRRPGAAHINARGGAAAHAAVIDGALAAVDGNNAAARGTGNVAVAECRRGGNGVMGIGGLNMNRGIAIPNVAARGRVENLDMFEGEVSLVYKKGGFIVATRAKDQSGVVGRRGRLPVVLLVGFGRVFGGVRATAAQ